MKKIVFIVCLFVLCVSANAQENVKTSAKFMLGVNDPKGEGKGIFPGRVVWSHAPGAATWNETDGFWFDDRWNNQEKCDWLVRKSLTELTGQKNEKAAWNAMVDIDYADTYLVEAATIPNSPSGTKYDPEQDGSFLNHSLGVMEHWNNAKDKKYSRNLGQKEGIELVRVEE